MMTRPTQFTYLALLAAGIFASGCSSTPGQELSASDFSKGSTATAAKTSAAADDAPAAPVQPADAGKTAPTAEPAAPVPTAAIQPDITPELKRELDQIKPPSVVAAPIATAKDAGTLTVDAMIGQVNGRPIYASQVLEPLKAQLNAMGQQMARAEFRNAAARILSERLYQIVFDSLFLAEAERRMTEQERFQLKVMMHLNRQELIRKYGAGSEPAANDELKKTTNRTLEETLEGVRQTILVRRYQDEVIYPKIAVSKRDVERFYNRPEVYEKYNPKPGRKVRLIRVANKTSAAKVDALFAEGKTFIEIAKDPVNQYNPKSEGKFMSLDKNNKDTDLHQGENLFSIDALNDALAKLKAGEHSPRIVVSNQLGDLYFWILFEEVIVGTRKSLPEVQLEIEQQIRGLQYMMIEQRYRKKLFEDAGYVVDGSTANPLDEMAASLVKIAVGLYTKGS
ncbi:MAG: hypothetical protein WD768_11225 [Phycisphaeraceae bacterium]